MKRIAICADGTWNRPEQLGKNNIATNVLKFARGIAPKDAHGVKQVVFYDWGIGSYHDQVTGGGMGAGLEKNVMDGYRFLVHNYEVGDEIFLFGFSRGAYTVRSLSGMLNNCGILKSTEAKRVEEAFSLYKNKKQKANNPFSKNWRKKYSINHSVKINFVGVWDTVGALGLPFSIFGLIKDKHLFYDNCLGSNVLTARHALSLDEQRDDFEPTLWEPHHAVDLKQVWFTGVHSDVGGGYKPEKDGTVLSDIPMNWLQKEARKIGLAFEKHMTKIKLNPLASKHNEYKGKYRLLGKRIRIIPNYSVNPTSVHKSVKDRYKANPRYKSEPVENYILKYGNWPPIES